MKRRAFGLAVLVAAAIVAAVAVASLTLPQGSGGARPAEDTFARQVRGYLMSHPEVIMEAVQVLERRRNAAQAEQQREALAAVSGVVRSPRGLPVAGNPEGDVTVVEFFDYRCGYCKQAVPAVEKLLETESGVRLVLKEFPILGPESVLASRIAIAANEQGKYLAVHRALLAHGGPYDEETLVGLAAEAGAEPARLRADMDAPAVEKLIAESMSLARRLGLTGTPAFIVGDSIVPGAASLETLRSLVARARAECATC